MQVDDLVLTLGVMLLIAGILCGVAAWCAVLWGDSFVDYHKPGGCTIPDCYECQLDGIASCPVCGCSTPDLRFHQDCLLAMYDEIDWEDSE